MQITSPWLVYTSTLGRGRSDRQVQAIEKGFLSRNAADKNLLNRFCRNQYSAMLKFFQPALRLIEDCPKKLYQIKTLALTKYISEESNPRFRMILNLILSSMEAAEWSVDSQSESVRRMSRYPAFAKLVARSALALPRTHRPFWQKISREKPSREQI